jgi:hypothetical protein
MQHQHTINTPSTHHQHTINTTSTQHQHTINPTSTQHQHNINTTSTQQPQHQDNKPNINNMSCISFQYLSFFKHII